MSNPIHQNEKGEWGFMDATEDYHGPYETEVDAKVEYYLYSALEHGFSPEVVHGEDKKMLLVGDYAWIRFDIVYRMVEHLIKEREGGRV